jgi:hypothetical protein
MYSIRLQSGTTTPKQMEGERGDVTHEKSVKCTLPLSARPAGAAFSWCYSPEVKS